MQEVAMSLCHPTELNEPAINRDRMVAEQLTVAFSSLLEQATLCPLIVEQVIRDTLMWYCQNREMTAHQRNEYVKEMFENICRPLVDD